MDKILRIAMLSIHSSPLGRLGAADTGGMSVYILELAAELGQLGHHVDIYSRQVQAESDRNADIGGNVRLIHLAIPGTENARRSELYDHLGGFCKAIADYAAGHSIKYDLLHSHYWLSGVVGNRLRAVWNCPHVVNFHTLAAVKMASLQGHNEDRRRLDNELLLLRESDGVIVPTREERLQLQRLYGSETAPLFTIPCGVRLESFSTGTPAAVKGQPEPADRSALLLFVGRFDPMKGLEPLLRSFRLLPSALKVDLVLIGGDGRDSPSGQWLNEYVERLGIAGRVHQLGPADHAEMPGWYQKADAVVMSSYYESFGLVILEALASGKPVVSTPVGIAPSVIKPGVNGYLAVRGDDSSLAKSISSVLRLAKTSDPQKIRESVSSYSWAKVATLMVDAYSSVLNRG
jgi:D-inositol-3-phosphate glycosyltransferase